MDAADKQVKDLKDRTRRLHTQDTGKMNSEADDSNKDLAELQSTSSDIRSLKDKKQFCQMFLEMKIKEQATEIQDKGLELEDMKGDHVSVYDFQADDQVPTKIRRTDGLGELVVKKVAPLLKGKTGPTHQATSESVSQNNAESLLQTELKTKTEGKKTILTLQDLRQRIATHVADINVKSDRSNKGCIISGVALLSEERLVVADWDIGTIKLINIPAKKKVSEFKLEKSPFDVAVCGEEVAATLPFASKIVFLKCDNGRLIHVRGVHVSGQCRGIDFTDNKLFVIYNKEQKLEIMTVTGTVLQKIDKNEHGGQLFKYPLYVTVSAANQSIYVSEWSEDKVTVLGLDGKVKGDYRDSQLGTPRQLAVDSAGVMYLCDRTNNTIHLLSPEGQMVKVLLTDQDGLCFPRSVCYCESTRRLYVGMWDDNIKIYHVTLTSIKYLKF